MNEILLFLSLWAGSGSNKWKEWADDLATDFQTKRFRVGAAYIRMDVIAGFCVLWKLADHVDA